MKSFLIKLFVENWLRKLISLILAMIIWMVINHSLTITKTIENIPVRIINLAPDKIIDGMLSDGILKKKMSLIITGNKNVLEELTGNDLQVIIDSSGKPDEWTAHIEKHHIISTNPNIDASKIISKVAPNEMILRKRKLVTEKIPVTVTQPIGEAPKGYQFLDIWPYQLSITIHGSEEAVKKLKARGLKLTYNLTDITRAELDSLSSNTDEVSYYVQGAWKKLLLPQLADFVVDLDDPQTKTLRIDFSREDILPVQGGLPVIVFFPPKYNNTLNPETYPLAVNDFIVKKNGIKLIQTPLYAKGVSRLFLETVKDMIQLVVIACPKSERETLLWNVQFMNPHELEDRYVAKVMSETHDEAIEIQPHLREDYLRNRFRSYMNRFRLYTPNNQKLSLKIELQAGSILVSPQNYPNFASIN